MKTYASILSALLSFAAVAAEMPRWTDILPLAENVYDSQAADAVYLGNETISDGIAWSCTLVPEGKPAMDKAAAYVRRFGAVHPAHVAVADTNARPFTQARLCLGYEA